jgi:hypothetical protein
MPIDPSIAMGVRGVQIEDPMNKLAQVMQLRAAQGQYDAQQREAESQNALRDLYKTGDMNSPEFRQKVYAANPAQGMAFDKNQREVKQANLEYGTKEFELASKKHDALSKDMGIWANTPGLSKPLVVAELKNRLDQGMITQTMFDASVAKLPDDPMALRQGLFEGSKRALSPEQIITLFAAKPVEQSNGQVKRFIDQNPNSPTYMQQQGQAVQLQASPDAVMTDRRVKSEGVLSRNNQLAIADRADARASAKLDNVKTSDKIASARLEETLQKTSKESKTRLTEIDTALRDIDRLENLTTGQNPSVSTGPIGQYLNNPFSADKQEVDKIQKKLANQILQEAKGAQTEGDAVRAERLVAITNMSDPVQRLKAMRQELAASRENAAYSVQDAAARIDEARAMGGRAPMGGSPTKPAAPAAASNQNAAAMAWLRANPNDPRAAAIKAKLGVQ